MEHATRLTSALSILGVVRGVRADRITSTESGGYGSTLQRLKWSSTLSYVVVPIDDVGLVMSFHCFVFLFHVYSFLLTDIKEHRAVFSIVQQAFMCVPTTGRSPTVFETDSDPIRILTECLTLSVGFHSDTDVLRILCRLRR